MHTPLARLGDELVDESALADAGFAAHQRDAPSPGGGLGQRLGQHGHVIVPFEQIHETLPTR